MALLASGLLCGYFQAQQVHYPHPLQGVLEPHRYMERGVIEHQHGTATVKADCARPLAQAITAVREEYGWAVDYEDPPYHSKYDVMDMTNPSYRAAHPDAPVVLGPAGGAFQSTYPETPNMRSSPAAEQEVLEKIVSDYNESGNPGDFIVRKLSNGDFDVVGDSLHNDAGVDVAITPVLDTPIYLARGTRSWTGTIKAISNALAAKTGLTMGIGLVPMAMSISPAATLTIGGSTAPAREFFMQSISGLDGYGWLFLDEPQFRQYLLGLQPVERVRYDSFGNRHLLPISPPPFSGAPQ